MDHPHPGHDDQDGQAGEEEYRPWYLEPNTPHPFKLSRKITVGPVLELVPLGDY